MAWFAGALQNARAQGANLKDRVREQARNIAARTQKLEEVIAGNLQNLQGAAYTAAEAAAQIEADARGLSRTGPATEVIQRWLMLLRNVPQPRYPDEGQDADITFRQVFLRSSALEYALDSVARTSELRAHLRQYTLPSPDVWPEERPPPVAFAHAFTTLLCVVIGPPEAWLALLGALLSSERGPADEPCHAWLLQLTAGLRINWEDASVTDREREVEAMEEAARQGLSAGNEAEVEASPGNLTPLLANLAEQRRTIGTSHRALRLRSTLASDLAVASRRYGERVQERAEAAAAVASVAAERVVVLDAETGRLHKNTEELKRELGLQAQEFQAQLAALEPDTQQLQREIEEVELTQQELQRQVQQLTEKLATLRKRQIETLKQDEALRVELRKVDSTLNSKLAQEEQVHCRTESARALAATVVDLAGGLAAPGKQDAQVRGAMSSANFAEEAEKSRKKAATAALALVEREVARLRLVARAVDVCVGVADERERSREALAKLGVSVATLESDVVGEAEIEQHLQAALGELERGQQDAETLCQEIASAVARGDDNSDGQLEFDQADRARASELVQTLRTCLDECSTRRERIAELLPQGIDLDAVMVEEEMAGAVDGTIDSFLQGTSEMVQAGVVPQTATNAAAKIGNLLGGLGLGGRRPSDPGGVAGSADDDDPFLLVGADGVVQGPADNEDVSSDVVAGQESAAASRSEAALASKASTAEPVDAVPAATMASPAATSAVETVSADEAAAEDAPVLPAPPPPPPPA